MELSGRYDPVANAWVVEVSGEVDIYDAPEMKLRLHKCIDKTPADLVLDCASLSYIDSTGMGVLISVLKHLKDVGKEMKIINLSPYIYKIFTITGLQNIFSIEVAADE
jgi:anti-sigma B factor antagonist